MLNKLIEIMQFGKKKNIPILPKLIQWFIRVIFACDIPTTVLIGKGTYFSHNGLGVVIHSQAIIGENCKVYQNVTIGGRNGRGSPIIEDNVFIGAGACILGGVTVGQGAVIGANAVIIQDIPPNSVVVGVPGRVIKK